MRVVPALPVLTLTLLVACGSSRLSRHEAERDLRKDYPVRVNVTIPESVSAIKGSPDHAKYVAVQEKVTPQGLFTVTRTAEGDRERFTFKPGPSAPKNLTVSSKGYEVPAAEAEFVRARTIEYVGGTARVTYQVRLVRPNVNFGLFQAMHPGVQAGETKDRHASYRREGRNWILQETDEPLKKAQ
jgi:hypothetical protein